MADRVGQQLGNYRLTRLLGKGGFGEVYQAEHRLLDRQQAIKVLLEQHFDDPRFLERFMREAKTLAKLDHPNIVHVDELGMEGNLVYLVMPYISGGTLQQVLKSRAGPLALNETERYFEQICSALDYAHTRGVVHLDLKPLNLLVHEDGRLLLSDFGLAHLMKEGALQGGTSLSFGTPLYMAPEHLRGQPDRRSDLYALGVMLYQMLTGRLPFQGSTPEAVMVGHLTEPPPPLLSANPALPPALDPVLSRALAKKPDERYQTAGELVAALKAGFSGRASQPLAGQSADAFAPTRYSQPVLDPTIRATTPPGMPLAPTQGQAPPVFPVVSQPSIHPGKIALVYRGHSEAVYTLAWSPDGRSIASGGGKYESKVGGSVQVFDALTGRLVANYRKHVGLVMSLSWSPDQQYLASASFDKTVHVWGALYENTILVYRHHAGGVSGVAWSPNGQSIVSCASGSSDQAQVWNPLTSALLLSYKGHSNSVVAVAWSPDGTRIASGSWDETVQVWDAQRGNTLLIYRGHLSKGDEKKNFIRALAWSPDGAYLASSNAVDARVHILDARTGRFALMYKGHAGPISALAWSPNGRYLASGSQDRTVQLWDPSTGVQLFIYRGHTDGIRSVAWSPDGRYIASAGMDKTVQIWQVG